MTKVGETSNPRRVIRIGLVLIGGLLLGLLLLGLAWFPPTENSIYPKCNFHKFTGLHCPGCGTTRAAHSLLNGRLEQSLAYNALIVILAPYLFVALARWAWFHFRGIELVRTMFPPWLLILMIVSIVLFWILRNLPWEPFTRLAPHELP